MSKEVARNIGMRYFLPSVKKGRCCRGSAPPRCVMAAGGNFWSFSLRRTTHSCKRGASAETQCCDQARALAWLMPRMMLHACSSRACSIRAMRIQVLPQR
jgi:hypothetical protein